MRPQDLMIDNYVYNINDPAHIPFQIKHIDTKTVMDKDGCYSNLSDIRPVILMPEMLEKNGFVYEPDSKNSGWWRYKQLGVKSGNEYIDIAFRNDGVANYDLEINKGNNTMILHLHFLPKLQQALKLSKVQKKIIL